MKEFEHKEDINDIPPTPRIMIVDDDIFFCKVLSRQLGTLGFSDITIALNGYLALQRVKEESPVIDLVFCDLRMPEMDGIAFLRHLTETGFTGQLVLMSGESERMMTSVKKLARAHDFHLLGSLTKPLKLTDIKQVLANDSHKSRPSSKAPLLLTRQELESGLESDALVLFYQPQIDFNDGSIAGTEVLLRWRNPDGVLIPPVCVIPAAEDYGLINQLTDKIFQHAIDQLKIWKNNGIELTISINLSMDNLQDHSLYDKLHSYVKAAGIDPANVILEITESKLAIDMRVPLELIGRFKLTGYGLSIDDFGTGYSTMEQLSGFPFDELKIDRQFVNKALKDYTAMSIIETSIALAKRLSMRVVAEGIETRDEWTLLRQKGCDIAQGYLVSKALPALEFEEWYKHWDGKRLE